ncbi:helix-turn-helix domain-containing protein [Pseudogulbenkiania sp. NH8B]|uniref:helix-turn-helix domain-containing protein n=1 Tax=Pseudogulbenkiania sp. (strain NH8B) TaxID=748280 RepID=UPI00351087F0
MKWSIVAGGGYQVDDEIFTLKEASAFMRLGERTLRDWVADGRLRATKSAKKGGKFLILKSDCIAAVRAMQSNDPRLVRDGHTDDQSAWPSSSEVAPGTVTSLRRTASELDAALAYRTKNRQRNVSD